MKTLSTLCFLALSLFLPEHLCAQANVQYTIPVVVHVIHNNGPENIPDSLIRDAIAEVNQNFNAQNAGLAGVAYPFVNIIGNMQIEFCLAHTDPQGLPASGIEHIVSPLTYYGDSLAVRINQWPQDKYMNIWVVDSLRSTSWSSFLPGMAVSPQDAATTPSIDGVVAAHFVFASGSRGLLTNLMAHYLNLENTWGNTNNPEIACGDDDVYDTPITKGNYLTCDTSLSLCMTGTKENVQNFMNYSYCACMFTQGQADRVHNALNSSVAYRNHLWSAANLATSCAAPTGIGALTVDNISVGPNPFTSEINIMGLHHMEHKVVLYDMVGRIVVDDIHFKDSTLALPDVATGMYILSVKDGNTERSFHVIKLQ